MKTIVNSFILGAAVGAGYSAGYYLWEEVLEDKMDDLICYFRNKKGKREMRG